MTSSPFMENLRQKDLQVLCMVDPVDEYAGQSAQSIGLKEIEIHNKGGLGS